MPDPGPGLVARPPPLLPLLPATLQAIRRHLSKSILVPLGGEPFLPSPYLLLVRGGGRGGPLFAPPPSPLSLPSPSPSGVTGPVVRESPSGCPLEKMDFTSLCPDHLPGPFSRGLSAPGELPILLGLSAIASSCVIGKGWGSSPSTRLNYPAVSAHYSSGSTGPSGGWDLGGFPFPTGEIPGTASDLVCPACPLCGCYIKQPAKQSLSFGLILGWHDSFLASLATTSRGGWGV